MEKDFHKEFKGSVKFFLTKLVKKYEIPINEIEELNQKYEEVKDKLVGVGHRLAGRIKSELEITNILQDLKIYKSFTECMDDYINHSIKFELLNNTPKNLTIVTCWINDMKEGEYNPPHTHNEGEGYSTVTFLKTPEQINDITKNEHNHKYVDGKIGFISTDGEKTHWVQPKVGDFFIFKATHQHCVMPFKTKIPGDIRRSMSFNFTAENK
jgi:hypothetical protein